jgi:hypothetical protein
LAFFTVGNYYFADLLAIILSGLVLSYTFRCLLLAFGCCASRTYSTCLLAFVPIRLVIYHSVGASFHHRRVLQPDLLLIPVIPIRGDSIAAEIIRSFQDRIREPPRRSREGDRRTRRGRLALGHLTGIAWQCALTIPPDRTLAIRTSVSD